MAAHSRLHFGLFSFGHEVAEGERLFGGVGAMIDQPRLTVTVEQAEEWLAVEEKSVRALEFARRAAAGLNLPGDFCCRVEVQHGAASHVGLGSGTQLALSVALAISRLAGLPLLHPEGLAPLMGRARRSSIGLHGFFRGGMIVDAGKRPCDAISPMLARIELPATWRFVLLTARDEIGLSGAAEERAFDMLPAVPVSKTRELRNLALENLMASAASKRFAEFAETLHAYGRRAGLLYEQQQGGPYASRRLERIVEAVRGLGAAGVTQSSWGPTLCVAMPDQLAAEEFAQAFSRLREADGVDMLITAAANRGAQLRVAESV